MPNITSILNDQIRRLAKREIKANTGVIRRATAEYRHVLAALKKQVADLTKRLAAVEKHAPKEIAPPPEVLEKGRFRAIGVKSHREKLGLSAKDYGQLAGVAPITIYQWESGKSEPRQAQKARWLAIRGLGKREALQRLGMAEPKAAPAPAAKPAPRQTKKLGQFKQTATEFVLSLLKGRRVLTTSQINAAWKKAGRGDRADKTLGLMVKARKLKRKPLGGRMGSEYRVG
ncbi:MAG: helix-turn-helix domain-containing protein [Phycisphaerae bacterium]